jgi:hypothetical protein
MWINSRINAASLLPRTYLHIIPYVFRLIFSQFDLRSKMTVPLASSPCFPLVSPALGIFEVEVDKLKTIKYFPGHCAGLIFLCINPL